MTGCYAQVDPEACSRFRGSPWSSATRRKAIFCACWRRAGEGTDGIRVSDIRQARRAESLPLPSFSERSRAFVQIQNGCDAFCSYCIIPYARGASRSVPPERSSRRSNG